MERWAGKVVVVTGASSGIGAAACVRLADEGLRVVGLARRSALIHELKSQIKGSGSIHPRQCDVCNADDIAESFHWIEQEFGGVDVMVNNAGVFIPGHITEVLKLSITDEDVQSLLDTNVRAGLLCTRRAVQSMVARGEPGHVICINSVAGQYNYIPFSIQFNLYPATKHAVTAFCSALLNEFAHTGSNIKVTSMCPDMVDTAMTKSLQMPMLSPADVADALVLALATPPHVNINEITIDIMGEKRP